MTIKAVYENGVFKPSEPVELTEGTVVELTLLDSNGQPVPAAEVAEAFERIAAMPLESGATTPSNRDHDKALYGGRRPE
jgi:predicted DNA-binding antitoxin AbrB/MazE fold protein